MNIRKIAGFASIFIIVCTLAGCSSLSIFDNIQIDIPSIETGTSESDSISLPPLLVVGVVLAVLAVVVVAVIGLVSTLGRVLLLLLVAGAVLALLASASDFMRMFGQ